MAFRLLSARLEPIYRPLLPIADALRMRELQSPFFFRGLAAVLLVIVGLGFAKSFYFRAGFQNFPVEPLVLVHGGVMTIWFLVFLMQTNFVPARHIKIHRRLGLGSSALALAIIATLVPTTYGFPARRFLADVPGYSFEADLQHITMVVHGNTAMLLQFTLLYGAGLVLRGNLAAHRRLMSLAAIAVVTPAASRLGTIVGPAGQTSQVLGIAFAFVLPLLLVGYDAVMQRRLHRVTLLGVGLIYGTLAVCGLIGMTPLGRAFTLWLASV